MRGFVDAAKAPDCDLGIDRRSLEAGAAGVPAAGVPVAEHLLDEAHVGSALAGIPVKHVRGSERDSFRGF